MLYIMRDVSGYDVGGCVMATVVINGLGRIGRATLKVLTGLDGIRIAAINDPGGLYGAIRDAHPTNSFAACSPGADVDLGRRKGMDYFYKHVLCKY